MVDYYFGPSSGKNIKLSHFVHEWAVVVPNCWSGDYQIIQIVSAMSFIHQNMLIHSFIHLIFINFHQFGLFNAIILINCFQLLILIC
jgi:hypothetical protein